MPSGIPRTEPAFVSDELTSLNAWLDFHRATLLQKCEGLTGEQLVQASVPTSALTLLGLLQHMAGVEWFWFDHVFAASDSPDPFNAGDDGDYEFTHLDPTNAKAMHDLFRRNCDISRRIVRAAQSLDELSKGADRTTRDLRWIMVHMVEEYARHNGHADLIREAIDGVVGD
jgi:hypothetical protein